MKKSLNSLLMVMLFFASLQIVGQDRIDNYSFFKLYVTNQEGEVLLVKWDGNWEIAGNRYNEPLSINNFLTKMADDMGIKISDPKLCGLYTQRWKGASNLSIMNYYRVSYVSGDPIIPPDCSNIKWFGFKEALQVIPYKNMVRMMKEIQKNPDKITGAAFERFKDENNKTQFVVLEDWHFMN